MTLESNLVAAFQAVGADIKQLKSTSGGVITSGPYTLDPKRAPAGSIVAVADTAVILTHIGTRFGATTVGAIMPTTDTPYNTVTARKIGSGSVTFESGGLFGKHAAVASTTTAADTVQTHTPLPAGIRDAQLSVVMRLPRPTTDVTVLSLYRTGGTALTIVGNQGAAGYVKFIVNDQSIAGWEYTSPDVMAGQTVRVAVGVQYVDGTGTSKLQVAFYNVAPDGNEVQIGTTYTNPAVNINGTAQALTGVAFGKQSTNVGSEGLTYRLDSVRVAHGAGAYNAGLLVDERLYPEPV